MQRTGQDAAGANSGPKTQNELLVLLPPFLPCRGAEPCSPNFSRSSLACAKRGAGQRRRLREWPGEECLSSPYIKLTDGRPTETEGTSENEKVSHSQHPHPRLCRFGLCGDRPIRQHVLLGSRQSQGRANGLLRQCDDHGQDLLLQQRGRQEPIHEESERQSGEGRVLL